MCGRTMLLFRKLARNWNWKFANLSVGNTSPMLRKLLPRARLKLAGLVWR